MTQSKNIDKFNIDEALDTLDLTFNGYMPSQEAFEFFVLMRLVTGKDFEFSTPLVHYFLVDLLLGNIDDNKHFPYSEAVRKRIQVNKKRLSVMMSRGLAKSSIVTCFFVVYTAIKGELKQFGKQYFYLGLGASAQGGGRVMAKAIQSMCEESDFCKEYFEKMRFTETESEFVRKGKSKPDERTFLFRTMGVGTGSIRGVRSNAGAHRPCAVFLDDCIANSESAYSEVQMTSYEEIMNSDIINALKGGGMGRIVNIFTPFHFNDPNVKTITSGAYTPLIIPICKYMDEDLEEEDFEGAWPAMHPYESVRDQYVLAKRSNSLRAFNQERMLRLASDEDRMVSDDMIQWYDRVLIAKLLDGYSLYITTDFTTTSAAKSDYSGIAVWAVSSNSDYFLLDVSLKRLELDQQYETLFRMVKTWGKSRYIEVGVEIDGQQKAHLFSLKQMMQKYNTYFSFAKQKGAPVNREGILSKAGASSKLERFRYMMPHFQNKKFYFPEQLKNHPDMKELLKQLKSVTFTGISGHDDGVDICSQLGMIDIRPGSGTEEMSDPELRADTSIWGKMWGKEEESGNSQIF